ncbi:hypothetical protein F511_07853 [Dorcoceras hygrometricum]|uniref:Uncharacterized protein n=1 Tax=Dorcoceras hygrometricum TaxID=472368 RepID=A0A2Z7B674_9LAMI|nr:hypothetical protein F511_07853 [Dorcoceras hygrometricum]
MPVPAGRLEPAGHFGRTICSELNLLHLPLFRHGKDPLEYFDYNGPRCNPLLRSAAARTPSNTTAHQPASCVCLTHFFNASLVAELVYPPSWSSELVRTELVSHLVSFPAGCP